MDTTNELDRDEKVLRNAIQFLIDGNEFNAAQILIHCDINITSRLFQVQHPHKYIVYYLTVALSGPRAAYDVIESNSRYRHPIGESIRRAFNAVIRQDQRIETLNVRVRSTPIEADECGVSNSGNERKNSRRLCKKVMRGMRANRRRNLRTWRDK